MSETTHDSVPAAVFAPGPLTRFSRAVTTEISLEGTRWFLWVPVLFGFGIAAYFQVRDEPALMSLAAIAGGAAALHLVGRRAGLMLLVTGAALAVAAGAFAAKIRATNAAAPILQSSTGIVDAAGWIERVEARVGQGQRLTVRLASLGKLDENLRPLRVRVRTSIADADLKAGVAVRFRATLGPPPLPAAPGDFDFARHAYFRGLGGFGVVQGRVRVDPDAGLAPLGVRLMAPVDQVRQAIRARITAALPGETGEIATALITGERGGITDATNQAYRDSGLFHILSISGLHMVIMAGSVFYVLRVLLASFPLLALRFPIKKWAALGAIGGAFGYLLISGAEFATVRSYVMITIMFMAVLLDRPALALRNVAVAALLILVAYPDSLFDPGFQMSFAAVTGLVSVYEYMRHRRGRTNDLERVGPLGHGWRFVMEIVVSTLIAGAAVAPFAIYHFHNTQMLALIANVVAIPICNLVVMPAALGVLIAMPFGIEALPLSIMGIGVDAMTAVARTVGALPGAVVKVPAIPTASFVLMVAGGLWLLLWTRPWRWLGVIGIIAGLGVAPTLRLPDMYVGRDGLTVAIRGAEGRLAALAVRGSSFELSRWLELDGDRRSVDAVATGVGFTCDAVGCAGRVAGRVVSVAVSPAAMFDDCARASVVVLRFRGGRGCPLSSRAQIVIDPERLGRLGAHALYIGTGELRSVSVAEIRGNRPWSGSLSLAQPYSGAANSPSGRDFGQGRLGGFTQLFERFRAGRPETDDTEDARRDPP